ncbi:unnamed protein product [Absidia cylindrospora]
MKLTATFQAIIDKLLLSTTIVTATMKLQYPWRKSVTSSANQYLSAMTQMQLLRKMTTTCLAIIYNLAISASNNTNVVMDMTSDDLLSRQQPISPINDQDNTEAVTEEIVNSHHHHHHHHHRYWTSPKHTSDSEPLHGCTLSTEASQVKLRKSAPSTTMHSQDLTFKTITLSPDHGHQNIIPPSLLTMATLNVPQKSTAGMAQQLLPPSNRTTLKTEEALPKPTTIRDIKTPSPLSSPITTQKQLLSPSLWPSMHPSNSPILERLDQMSSPEPSEFYSPNLVLDNDNDDDDDDLQQANRRNTISRIITSPTSDDAPFLSADDMNDDDSHRLDLDKDQNGTSGWAVTLGFQGFFDRIKTVFG